MAGRSQEIANLQVGLDMDMQSFARELSNAKKNVRNLSKDFDVASKSIDNAEDKVEAYAQALQKGNKAFDATENKLKMQNKQFDELYKKTEKQKKQYDELANELKKAEKALTDMTQKGDKSSSAYKEQEKSVKDLKKALSDKLELVQKNSHKLQQYSTDIDRTSNDLNKLKNSMDDLKQGMDGIGEGSDELALIGDNAEKTGISLDNLALGAKASAIAIASVFAKNVYDGAIAFDDAITGLRLSLGLAEKDAKALYEQVNAIAGDGGYSLEGVTESVTLLQKRFNLTDAETKNLAQSMDLLSKMGYENTDVTRFMTSAVNDWGMSHSEALDMIIAGEQSGLNISNDWLDTLVEYTPILSTLGVKGEEAFALVDEAVNATGMTTDQAMDMVKEFFLTLTDGSTTSKDAFADLGIDIDDLKTKINDGSITSVDAMQQVMTAIMGVGDETERARLLQEIFKGTIEYGSEGVVQAWSNMQGAVKNTSGAMDEAKQAYEESYQAMQQDLSNEWNELTQTIGSKAIPALIKVVDTATKVVQTMGLFPQAVGRFFTQIKNDIANAMDGGYGAVLEFVSNTGNALADMAEGMGFDGWADSIRERMEPVDAEHKKIVDNIRRREQETAKANEEYAKELEQIWNNTDIEPKINTENAKQQVVELTNTYQEIPLDVKTILKAEKGNSEEETLRLYNLYEQLPKDIQTLIKADNYNALDGAKNVQDVLQNIPVEKRIDLLTQLQEEGNMTTEQLQLILNSLPEEERIKIETQIAGKEKVEQTKKDIDNLPKDSKAKVSVDTGDSKERVQGVKKEVESVNGKVSKVTFHTETAGASKNVTGLKKNISDYDKKNTGKTKKTTFQTITAQASKNVTGLKNNISNFVSRFAKTFTTTFKVVTKYITQGSPTPQSKGTKPTVRSASIQATSVNTQASTPMANTQSSPSETAIPRVAQPTRMVSALSQDFTRGALKLTNFTPISIGGGDIADGLEYNIDLLKELDAQLKIVTNQIDLLDKKAENATGQEKINYLKQQNDLYREQQDILKKQEDYLTRQRNYYKYSLGNRGVQFNSDGNMTNYEELLIKKEKELKALEQKANKENASDSDKKAYENAKSALDDLKKYADEYYKVTFDELPKVQQEWQNLENDITKNTNSITDAKDAIKDFNKEVQQLRLDTAFTSVQKHVDELNNQLKMLDIRLENAFGQNKNELLQEKVDLLHKQKQEMKDVVDYLKKTQNSLKGQLNQKGFNIDDKGNIRNYDSHMEELKKTLSKEDFTEVEKLAKEYLDLLVKEVPKAEQEWADLDNEIREHKNQLEKIQRQLKLDLYINKLKELENEYDKFSDKLDVIDTKLKHAHGQEKIDLLEEQMKLLEQQKKKQEEMANQYKSMMKIYQSDLSEFGIKFDNEGDISNLDEILNKYQSHQDIEKLKDLVDEYLDIQRDKLPDAEKKWEDLNNAIKDACKEQLEVIKDIEDEITKVYKKQVQDRIDLINKELDSRLKALDKEKKAYDDARKEADYKRDYQDQLDVVEDLERQLEVAKKDDSMMGKKKVEELLKQLKEEQKKLEDMVQDKIDSDINDMFDEESDRLTDSAKDTVDDLEKEFSDSKIAELVAQALGSGVFTDIEGNVSSLEDALVNFADETGDLFGVLGSTIEKELIGKLQEAIDSFKDLDEIYGNLGINSSRSFSMPNVDYNSARYAPSSNNNTVNNTNNSKVEVNFNQPFMVIEGNVTEDIMPQVENMVKKAQQQVVKDIVKAKR
ncbi:phage tail tape measure protein [Romboutsia lituseburensis]|uniref:phage tail tape measure protein n=1 Tax=Romboutsia lituseburensis TaxID=1537 RepID=UPI0022EAA8D2|nr:phage tail tape measure protein [Romboutsia lituseburensis]